MATQIYTAGPVYTWVGLGASNAYLYLGWTEQGMTVSVSQITEDVHTDYAGNMPADVSFLGETWMCQGTLTRFDDQVMQKVISWKGPNGVAGSGTISGYSNNSGNTLGSLVNAEGLSYPLLLFAPYSFKNIYTGVMVPGWYIPYAVHSEQNRRILSVKRTGVDVSFEALPQFGTAVNGTYAANQPPYNDYQLYSNVMPNPLPLTT